MVRKLGIKGFIEPTANRRRANALTKRKMSIDAPCFWSASDTSLEEDYDVLIGVR